MEDRPLLDAYRRGEKPALTEIFDAYAPKVLRWVQGGFSFSSRGQRQRFDGFRSPADTHDTTHEVFRRAFEDKTRNAYSGLVPFEGYLFVITRNVVLRRIGVKRVESVAPEDLDQLPVDARSPEEEVARKQERDRVRQFLATLTDEQRRFAELRFVERDAQAEVARKLGMTRKKVRLMETAIRTALARHLLRARGSLEITEAAHEGSH